MGSFHLNTMYNVMILIQTVHCLYLHRQEKQTVVASFCEAASSV